MLNRSPSQHVCLFVLLVVLLAVETIRGQTSHNKQTSLSATAGTPRMSSASRRPARPPQPRTHTRHASSPSSTSSLPNLECRTSGSCGDRCSHTEFWRRFPEFRRRKRHDAAFLLGNGPSANILGSQESHLMMGVADIWVANQFFVHRHVTPDFHHIEIKGFTERFWMDNFTPEIKEKYRDRSTFVWSLIRTMKNKTDTPDYCRNADGGVGQRKCMADCGPCSKRVLDMTGCPSFVYTLDSMLPDDQVAAKAAGEPVNFQKVLLKTRKCPTIKPKVEECALGKSCYSSMTTVLDMIVRMGYKRLYILGVDLNSHRHFYNAGTPTAGELKSEYKHLILPRSMNETDSGKGVHKTATLGVQHFIPALISRYEIQAFNLSPTSLLRDSMKTLSLSRVAMLERRRQISARRTPRPSDYDHDDGRDGGGRMDT